MASQTTKAIQSRNQSISYSSQTILAAAVAGKLLGRRRRRRSQERNKFSLCVFSLATQKTAFSPSSSILHAYFLSLSSSYSPKHRSILQLLLLLLLCIQQLVRKHQHTDTRTPASGTPTDRPTLSNFRGFKTSRSTFLNYI